MLKFLDNYPLSKLTTLQIGGPAKKFVAVKSQKELIEAILFAKNQQLPYLLIGGGSNLLIADEGVDYLVIKNEITGIELDKDILKVKSGTPLQQLVDYAISHKLAGLQKLAGIPGTVGGAVYGNAGAYGQAISDCLIEVTVFDGKNILTFTKDGCNFNYRYSGFKKNHFTILRAKFLLTKSLEPLQEEAKEVLKKRLVKYPKGIKCPGSFFKNLVASELPAEVLKNIPQDKIVYGKVPAGTLLEEVGAKSQVLNGIEIASYHANLFLNTDAGTAKDFHTLARKYVQKVKEKFGISLEPEVQLINLPPLLS